MHLREKREPFLRKRRKIAATTIFSWHAFQREKVQQGAQKSRHGTTSFIAGLYSPYGMDFVQ